MSSTPAPRSRRRKRRRARRLRLPATTRGRVALAGGLAALLAVTATGAAILVPGEPNGRAVNHVAAGQHTPTPEPTPTEPPGGPVSMDGRAPLTGVLTADDLARPAITVKVSNTRDAHPHRGLEGADIVFVEPITGATTRLAAIFHSTFPDQIGPVRSLRPMDAPLIGPTGGVIGNTMAAPWVLDYVDSVADWSNLGTMRVPRGTYFIDNTRIAPNHVFAQPPELLAETTRTAAPAPYFAYAHGVEQSSAQTDGEPASSVVVGYGDPSTATWTYDPDDDRWLRAEQWSEHVLESGEQVWATNVVVLHAARDHSLPQAGPEMTVLDLIDTSGTLEAFTGDQVVTGRWSKGGVNDPFEFTTDDGEPLLLAPGSTWIECALDTMPVTIS